MNNSLSKELDRRSIILAMKEIDINSIPKKRNYRTRYILATKDLNVKKEKYPIKLTYEIAHNQFTILCHINYNDFITDTAMIAIQRLGFKIGYKNKI